MCTIDDKNMNNITPDEEKLEKMKKMCYFNTWRWQNQNAVSDNNFTNKESFSLHRVFLLPLNAALVLRILSRHTCGAWHCMDVKTRPSRLERNKDLKPLKCAASEGWWTFHVLIKWGSSNEDHDK